MKKYLCQGDFLLQEFGSIESENCRVSIHERVKNRRNCLRGFSTSECRNFFALPYLFIMTKTLMGRYASISSTATGICHECTP